MTKTWIRRLTLPITLPMYLLGLTLMLPGLLLMLIAQATWNNDGLFDER